jgi:hypothetical protein
VSPKSLETPETTPAPPPLPGGVSAANEPASQHIPPYAIVSAIAAAAVLWWVATQPVLDFDLPWHILVGREIMSGVWPGQAARGWSFADVPDTWVSTQWIAEVVFAWLRDTFGWSALLWYRYLTTIAIMAIAAGVINIMFRANINNHSESISKSCSLDNRKWLVRG